MTLIETLKALPEVETIKPYDDRHYINLVVACRSRANADLRTKIWIKGDILTVESGKGYHSDAYLSAKRTLIAAAEAAGATIRQV